MSRMSIKSKIAFRINTEVACLKEFKRNDCLDKDDFARLEGFISNLYLADIITEEENNYYKSLVRTIY